MHPYRALLISLIVGASLSCTARDVRRHVDTARPTTSSVAATASGSDLADTEVVRHAGVPTDPDDTAATHYGKHETPRRLTNPACRPQGPALCLRDTAATVYSVDCCMANERRTSWLIFAAARDSTQLFLDPPTGTYLTMAPANAAGAITETALGVDAPWLRARFPVSGAYVFTAGIESEEPILYELRVAPVVTTGASQPIGASAILTLIGAHKAIAVAPRSLMPSDDSNAMRHFAVKPGRYRVLLVRDTLYVACALPCVHSTVFALRAGQTVAITP
jgi:hypothetical protein